MLFSVIYKSAQSNSTVANISGDSISSVLVYCDANNFTPLQISQINDEVRLVNTSSEESYSVNLKNTTTEQTLSLLIYDTLSNVMAFVNSSGLQLRNLNRQDRNFIQA